MEPKCELCSFFKTKPHCGNCKMLNRPAPVIARPPQAAECSPEEFIEYLMRHHGCGDKYVPGDYTYIELITGEKIKISIADEHKDVLADKSGFADITLIASEIDGCYEMNTTNTNTTSWRDSKGRIYANRFYNLLPPYIQQHIVPVIKRTSAGGRSRNIVLTEDKIFMLSESEVIGVACYSVAGEGEQYAIYEKEANRSFKGYTWLRSPRYGYSNSFCFVNSGGSSGNGGATSTNGVVFGFCLSSKNPEESAPTGAIGEQL